MAKLKEVTRLTDTEIKSFRNALREKDFVVTAEVPFDPSTSADTLRQHAQILAPHVDALQVGEDRMAQGRMATLAVASIVLAQGTDVVLHLSCRDRNRVALQGEILGAAALGVTSLIPHRGRKMPESLKGQVKGVFDSTPTQLIETAERLGQQASLKHEQEFLIGSFVTVLDPGEDWQAVNLNEKIASGARLLQTLPCLNLALLQRYAARLVAMKMPHRGSLLVDVPLMDSAGFGDALKRIYPGSPLPASAIERMRAALDPRAEGIAMCAEALSVLAETPGVSGVNILYNADPEAVLEALSQAGIGRGPAAAQCVPEPGGSGHRL